VSTLLHATVYMFLHNLLNVLVQIANKMGLQKKIGLFSSYDAKLVRRCDYSPQIKFYSRMKIQDVTGPVIKN
jgi:hypothetical protein